MKTGFAIAICIALHAAPVPARQTAGTEINGNQFEMLFDEPQDREMGLLAAVSAFDHDPSLGSLICVPPGVTKIQAAKVLDQFMQQNPQILNFSMYDITSVALMKAFPCS